MINILNTGFQNSRAAITAREIIHVQQKALYRISKLAILYQVDICAMRIQIDSLVNCLLGSQGLNVIV